MKMNEISKERMEKALHLLKLYEMSDTVTFHNFNNDGEIDKKEAKKIVSINESETSAFSHIKNEKLNYVKVEDYDKNISVVCHYTPKKDTKKATDD